MTTTMTERKTFKTMTTMTEKNSQSISRLVGWSIHNAFVSGQRQDEERLLCIQTHSFHSSSHSSSISSSCPCGFDLISEPVRIRVEQQQQQQQQQQQPR